MGKTRVHELAAEFGISAEQLMGLLKEMGIFVRTHMSALEPDQVAAVRVRWEREKRKPAVEEAPKKGRRKAAKAAEAAPAAETAKPVRRRRTAAEVAQAEAAAEAERAKEEAEKVAFFEPIAPSAEEKKPLPPSLEERAKLLFKDLPPAAEAEAEAPEATAAPAAETERAAPEPPRPAPLPPELTDRPAPPAPGRIPPRPAAPPAAAGGAPTKQPFIPPRIQRPAPGAARGPGGPGRGPRPVFSSSGGATTPAAGEKKGPGGRPGSKKGDAYGDRGRGKKGRKADAEAVQANILKTLHGMRGTPGKKGRRSDGPTYTQLQEGLAAEERQREKTRVRVNEFVSVSELADLMKISATQIVQFAFKELGLMVTVNQRLDFDQIELIASAFGFEAVKEEEYQAEVEAAAPTDAPEDLRPRPPVVTIMGHVDHGKTSLLDHIRKANVVAGEAGGITQHIGAYHVTLGDGTAITFLDTPGHQAFTAMRARGAQVTDIVVLVVAADDSVMPQTIEAISHARNAGVPIIVAINKIDLPGANPEKVKQELLSHNVILEQFGGQVLSAEISAKKGTNIDQLMEQLLLQAEILDLKANPDGAATGSVIEATLDPGKGPLATILVQRGTLRVGDDFISGKFSGRVRAMFDERGKPVKQAGPSIPVQILGYEGVPSAGDSFSVVADAVSAREIAQKRQRLEREAQSRRTQRGSSLEDFSRQLAQGQVSSLRLIIKADQGGPAEALADALAQLGTDEVRVEVVHRGVGAITESDVLLAKTSGAIVIGFHVRPDSNARATAERENVDVRTYRIIYEAVDDVRAALEGLLKPEEKEVVLGEAEVLQIFKVSKVGTIAGCIVRNGVIQRGNKVRVLRDGAVVYTGGLSSLKRFKDDVREVKDGLECGIGVENFNDLKVGDRIESFKVEEVKRTLAASSGAGA
ncbi:MAG TPA: translation initiation factor IF-2 [Gemmatimonadales bacterium]|nr:translation initiation factor IF-2 [Gemmatimonadales bacterium]